MIIKWQPGILYKINGVYITSSPLGIIRQDARFFLEYTPPATPDIVINLSGSINMALSFSGGVKIGTALSGGLRTSLSLSGSVK